MKTSKIKMTIFAIICISLNIDAQTIFYTSPNSLYDVAISGDSMYVTSANTYTYVDMTNVSITSNHTCTNVACITIKKNDVYTTTSTGIYRNGSNLVHAGSYLNEGITHDSSGKIFAINGGLSVFAIIDSNGNSLDTVSSAIALAVNHDSLYVASGVGLIRIYPYAHAAHKTIIPAMYNPSAVTICNGYIYIIGTVNLTNYFMYKFSMNGALQSSTPLTNAPLTSGGIAHDNSGNIYWVDGKNVMTISGPLSVNEIGMEKQFSVYPNPSSSTFHISGKGIAAVYSVSGQLITSLEVKGDATFDVMTPGVYIVRMNDQTFKVIKQ